jgi:hypothetical protein
MRKTTLILAAWLCSSWAMAIGGEPDDYEPTGDSPFTSSEWRVIDEQAQWVLPHLRHKIYDNDKLLDAVALTTQNNLLDSALQKRLEGKMINLRTLSVDMAAKNAFRYEQRRDHESIGVYESSYEGLNEDAVSVPAKSTGGPMSRIISFLSILWVATLLSLVTKHWGSHMKSAPLTTVEVASAYPRNAVAIAPAIRAPVHHTLQEPEYRDSGSPSRRPVGGNREAIYCGNPFEARNAFERAYPGSPSSAGFARFRK